MSSLFSVLRLPLGYAAIYLIGSAILDVLSVRPFGIHDFFIWSFAGMLIVSIVIYISRAVGDNK